jgi:hypothetical protein
MPFDWLQVGRIEDIHAILANDWETFVGEENWLLCESDLRINKHHRHVFMRHYVCEERRRERVKRFRGALHTRRVCLLRFENSPGARTLRLAGALARRLQAPILLIYPPDPGTGSTRVEEDEQEKRLADAGEVLVVRVTAPITLSEYLGVSVLTNDVTGLDWPLILQKATDLRGRFEAQGPHIFVPDEEIAMAELTTDQLLPTGA